MVLKFHSHLYWSY